MITDLGSDRGSARAQRVAMYLRSCESYYRNLRNQRRVEWAEYYETLERNHRALAEHNRRAREKLLAELEQED